MLPSHLLATVAALAGAASAKGTVTITLGDTTTSIIGGGASSPPSSFLTPPAPSWFTTTTAGWTDNITVAVPATTPVPAATSGYLNATTTAVPSATSSAVVVVNAATPHDSLAGDSSVLGLVVFFALSLCLL